MIYHFMVFIKLVEEIAMPSGQIMCDDYQLFDFTVLLLSAKISVYLISEQLPGVCKSRSYGLCLGVLLKTDQKIMLLVQKVSNCRLSRTSCAG